MNSPNLNIVNVKYTFESFFSSYCWAIFFVSSQTLVDLLQRLSFLLSDAWQLYLQHPKHGVTLETVTLDFHLFVESALNDGKTWNVIYITWHWSGISLQVPNYSLESNIAMISMITNECNYLLFAFNPFFHFTWQKYNLGSFFIKITI